MKISSVAVAGVVSALLTTAAHAEKFANSTWLPPTHQASVEMQYNFSDRVRERTNGSIDFEVFPGAALLPAAGTMEGLRTGVAQASIYSPPYAPTEFPILNAIGGIGFVNPDPTVLTFAMADMLLHNPELDDWNTQGVVYIAALGTPTYEYICRTEGAGKDMASLQGLKVRTNGGVWTRATAALGMTPVNMPGSEIYTGMERGAVDCLAGDMGHLIGGTKIGELVKSVAMIHLPPVYDTGGIILNKDFWKARTNEERQILLEEGFHSTALVMALYARDVETNLAWAKEKGIEINEPGEDVKAAYKAFLDDGMGGSIKAAKEELGVEDPEKHQAVLIEYINKWTKLLEGVDRTDGEATWAVLKANALADIDPATYRMD